jgi:hypothetical protein
MLFPEMANGQFLKKELQMLSVLTHKSKCLEKSEKGGNQWKE